MYSPGHGQTVLMSIEKSCHFIRSSLKKMSFKSDFIQFFHDLIHVYSPGAGADYAQQTKC